MIKSFDKDNYFLSNFYEIGICIFGHVFASSEHAYQAAKATSLEDFNKIRLAATPALAKSIAKTIVVNPSFHKSKIDLMKYVVKEKFLQHEELSRKLLETNEKFLMEGNWWGDTFWGVCNGVGENHLGQILMQIREEIK